MLHLGQNSNLRLKINWNFLFRIIRALKNLCLVTLEHGINLYGYINQWVYICDLPMKTQTMNIQDLSRHDIYILGPRGPSHFLYFFHLLLHKPTQTGFDSNHCMEMSLARILITSWFYILKKTIFKHFILKWFQVYRRCAKITQSSSTPFTQLPQLTFNYTCFLSLPLVCVYSRFPSDTSVFPKNNAIL